MEDVWVWFLIATARARVSYDGRCFLFFIWFHAGRMAADGRIKQLRMGRFSIVISPYPFLSICERAGKG